MDFLIGRDSGNWEYFQLGQSISPRLLTRLNPHAMLGFAGPCVSVNIVETQVITQSHEIMKI